MDRYENLDKALCKELERLDKKYAADVGEMSEQDAHKADMLYHALKSAETYYAMKDEYGDDGEYSEAGGRMVYRGSYARDRARRAGRNYRGMYSGRYPMEYDPYYGGY
jgi:hypothetical protein